MSNLIKISKEFHINGSGLWLGTEVSIPDESNEEQKIEAFQKEYITLVKAAQRLNPGISVTQTPEPTVIQREPEPIGDIIAHMKTCTELNVLKTYKLLVKSGTEEEKVYLEMLEKLSTKSQNHECV